MGEIVLLSRYEREARFCLYCGSSCHIHTKDNVRTVYCCDNCGKTFSLF